MAIKSKTNEPLKTYFIEMLYRSVLIFVLFTKLNIISKSQIISIRISMVKSVGSITSYSGLQVGNG